MVVWEKQELGWYTSELGGISHENGGWWFYPKNQNPNDKIKFRFDSFKKAKQAAENFATEMLDSTG